MPLCRLWSSWHFNLGETRHSLQKETYTLLWREHPTSTRSCDWILLIAPPPHSTVSIPFYLMIQPVPFLIVPRFTTCVIRPLNQRLMTLRPSTSRHTIRACEPTTFVTRPNDSPHWTLNLMTQGAHSVHYLPFCTAFSEPLLFTIRRTLTGCYLHSGIAECSSSSILLGFDMTIGLSNLPGYFPLMTSRDSLPYSHSFLFLNHSW